MDDLIIHLTRWNFAGPADDEWGAKRGLHRSDIRTTPWTTVSLPGVRRLRAVIAGENDDGIIFDTRFLDGIEDLARAIVHLGEAVGPIAIPGPARELRIRQRRHVNQ